MELRGFGASVEYSTRCNMARETGWGICASGRKVLWAQPHEMLSSQELPQTRTGVSRGVQTAAAAIPGRHRACRS